MHCFFDSGILISVITELKFSNCQWEKKYYFSEEIYPKTRGQTNYETNTTAVVYFREIRHGHQAIKSPAPMNLGAYTKTNSNLRGVGLYNNVSNETMQQTACETKRTI